MRTKPLILIAFVLSLVLVSVSTTAQAQTSEPTNVGLVYFGAETRPNGVLLIWETATELNAAGFIIHRRTGSSGDFVYLENIGFIDAVGSPALGDIYEALDNSAVLGQTYTYRLIEIEYNSQQIILRDVTITFGATPTPPASPTPTATATAPSNPGGATTATPTSTTAATTAASTATPISQPTLTPVPPTAAAPGFATATPAGGAAPAPANITSSATAVSPAGAINPTQPAANPTAVTQPDRSNANTGAVAQAQEPEPPTESYPLEQTAPGEGDNAGQPPADDQPQTISEPESIPLPVIGSGEAYTAPPAPPAVVSSQTSDGRSTLYLWVGFIVALLIFITGVIGSVILYTRRAR